MAELKNVRHETFAQGIAAGQTQRTAYRAAYPKSINWKDETVDKRASELMKNGEVLGRIEELRKLTTSEAVMDITQRKEWLTKVVQNSKEKTKDRLGALDMLNKMEGVYVTKLGGEVKLQPKLEDLL
ncbi:MAG: terminase [Firmicutes bacterium]|nr:terminase [Bacillota bacterium]